LVHIFKGVIMGEQISNNRSGYLIIIVLYILLAVLLSGSFY